MARFYGSMENSRDNEVTAMSPDQAHIRGWHAGVKVLPRDDKGQDTFEIYMTGGSRGTSPQRYLGRVRMTPDGPVFEPNEAWDERFMVNES